MTLACFALHTVGINVDTRAQVRQTSTAFVNELSEYFCIPVTRHLQTIMHLY